jgi:rsbT co-antagonist protein RsbR
MAIIDITGVHVMDQPAVQGIISAVQCLRLVGAEVMLTGVQPQVAAALVDLNMDLSGIKTSRSLQSAIVEALRREK